MNLKNTEVGQWKPGQSGNPSGKPKGTKHRATIVKKWLDAEQDFINPITEEIQSLTQEEIMILAQIRKARAGDSKAFELLMEFGYVKEEQTIGIEITEVIMPKAIEDEKNDS